MSEQQSPAPPVEIPPGSLEPEVLQAVVESFILREGTDYGANEISLETKIEQVMGQIQRDEIVIAFDPNTESVTLLTRQQWKKLSAPLPS